MDSLQKGDGIRIQEIFKRIPYASQNEIKNAINTLLDQGFVYNEDGFGDVWHSMEN